MALAEIYFLNQEIKMTNFPTLETERLILNRPTENDLGDLILHLNSDNVFSENTLNIPFPYQNENAEFWIHELVNKGFEEKKNFTFAIREKENPKLIGAIGIHLDKVHLKAEIGYWIGKDFWNKGFVTEAVREIIRFGFQDLGLNKIYATHFPHNPASGKIMQNCGMKLEATLKQEYFKNGKPLDVLKYSVLKQDFVNLEF